MVDDSTERSVRNKKPMGKLGRVDTAFLIYVPQVARVLRPRQVSRFHFICIATGVALGLIGFGQRFDHFGLRVGSLWVGPLIMVRYFM